MVTALKQTVKIQQGGRIEIRSSELPEGFNAEVIVLLESIRRTVPLASLIGKGKGGFDSAKNVDAHLREERDSWDS
jgi:hypothetical protein